MITLASFTDIARQALSEIDLPEIEKLYRPILKMIQLLPIPAKPRQPGLRAVLVWTLVALALWLVVTPVCGYAIARWFHSAWQKARILMLDES